MQLRLEPGTSPKARVNGVPTLARKSESAVFFPDDSQICGLGRERRHGESRSVGMINQSQTHRLPITPGRFLRFQQRAVEFGDQLVPLDRYTTLSNGATLGWKQCRLHELTSGSLNKGTPTLSFGFLVSDRRPPPTPLGCRRREPERVLPLGPQRHRHLLPCSSPPVPMLNHMTWNMPARRQQSYSRCPSDCGANFPHSTLVS